MTVPIFLVGVLLRLFALAGLLCASLAGSGCTTVIVGEGSTHDIVSIGVTRIVVPERKGEVIAFRRTGVGVGFGNAVGSSAFLGFDQGEWVLADPAACQMLVVIRSDAETETTLKILEKLEGENICYVNDTQD